MTEYAPGTPSWVDLTTPDLTAAVRFYGELFGWEAVSPGTPEETGGYQMFLYDGKRVAGVSPVMSEGAPIMWATYFATDDVDALAARVAEAGGSALFEPMDITDAGRMAFFMHPAAGAFGAWQAGEHKGAELVNEPVSLTWNSLITPDPEGAIAFLEAVMPLRAAAQDIGGSDYTLLHVGDRPVAGVMPPPPGMPDGVPAFWDLAFAVTDADATAAKAQALGGEVRMEPMDMPGVGRIAGLADPWGAGFGVAALVGG